MTFRVCDFSMLLNTFLFSLLRQYNVDYKLDTYLKIARLYLEDDDPVQAEAYINRASLLQNESSNEQLQIHYKVHKDIIATDCVCITVTFVTDSFQSHQKALLEHCSKSRL